MKNIIVLSPHLDDAALSCGEYIKHLKNDKCNVSVITIFPYMPKDENPTELEKKFLGEMDLQDEVIKTRQSEDANSMHVLNVNYRYLPLYECLYRTDKDGKHKYLKDFAEIYQQNLDIERDTIEDIKKHLKEVSEKENIDEIIAPLGIGRHIDHLVTRKAAEELQEEKAFELGYYEDVPYVGFERDKTWDTDLINDNIKSNFIKITEDEWDAKVKAIECYKSQINMLWGSREEQRRQYNLISHRQSEDYRSIRLWKKCK